MQLLDRLVVLSRRFYNKAAELLYSSGFILNLAAAVRPVPATGRENVFVAKAVVLCVCVFWVRGPGQHTQYPVVVG
jgi:hypothetical protein